MDYLENAGYYDGFGSRTADNCLVAEVDGKVVGAVWTMSLPLVCELRNDITSLFRLIAGKKLWKRGEKAERTVEERK